MKDNLIAGLKISINYILCLVFSAVIVVTCLMVTTILGTKEIGYDVLYLNQENGKYTELYTHYSADGEDTLWSDYEEKGYQLVKEPFRSKVSSSVKTGSMLLIQFICIWCFIKLMHSPLYHLGDTDLNKVTFGHIKYDRWRGFKVGLVPATVNIIAYILLILSKTGIITNGYVMVFQYINIHLYGSIQLITDGATQASQIGWGTVVLLVYTVFFTPLLCQLFYTLGYKRIDIAERIVYKKRRK